MLHMAYIGQGQIIHLTFQNFNILSDRTVLVRKVALAEFYADRNAERARNVFKDAESYGQCYEEEEAAKCLKNSKEEKQAYLLNPSQRL